MASTDYPHSGCQIRTPRETHPVVSADSPAVVTIRIRRLAPHGLRDRTRCWQTAHALASQAGFSRFLPDDASTPTPSTGGRRQTVTVANAGDDPLKAEWATRLRKQVPGRGHAPAKVSPRSEREDLARGRPSRSPLRSELDRGIRIAPERLVRTSRQSVGVVEDALRIASRSHPAWGSRARGSRPRARPGTDEPSLPSVPRAKRPANRAILLQLRSARRSETVAPPVLSQSLGSLRAAPASP